MSSVFNDSERLYRTIVCHCLVHGPYYSARLMRFGSRGLSEHFSDTPPKYLDRDCVGKHRTGTRLGNVYRSIREKQGIVTRNYCLSATCFTNSDIFARCFTSISRARPPENHKYQSPARSQTFPIEKNFPRESGGRLFTVLYFSVRSSRSSALCYGLPSCMSVKTT